jgi:hypothetical protein
MCEMISWYGYAEIFILCLCIGFGLTLGVLLAGALGVTILAWWGKRRSK